MFNYACDSMRIFLYVSVNHCYSTNVFFKQAKLQNVDDPGNCWNRYPTVTKKLLLYVRKSNSFINRSVDHNNEMKYIDIYLLTVFVIVVSHADEMFVLLFIYIVE